MGCGQEDREGSVVSGIRVRKGSEGYDAREARLVR